MPVKNFKSSQSKLVPDVGTIMPFAGPITQTSSGGVITTTAPEGWLLCNGNSILNTVYPILVSLVGLNLPNLLNTFTISTSSGFSYTNTSRTRTATNHVHNVGISGFSFSNNTTSQDHNHYILSRNPVNQTNANFSGIDTQNFYHDHGGQIQGYSYASTNTVGQGNGNSQANLISNTHNHSTGSTDFPHPGSYTNFGNAAHTHAYYDPANANAGVNVNSGSSGVLTHSHTTATNNSGIAVPTAANAAVGAATNDPKHITFNFIIKADR